MYLTDSVDVFSFYPEYDFTDSSFKNEEVTRTRDGSEYRYKFGEVTRIDFTVRYVSSADATKVQNWYSDNTSLFLYDDVHTHSIRIVNTSKPLSKRVRPYDDLFEGKLELESY